MPIEGPDPAFQGGFERSVGDAILGELVKSYGFRQTGPEGRWDWSVSNVVQAFQDEPFWTTVDWLTTAVPVLAWGRAASLVKTGKGLTGTAVDLARGRGLAEGEGAISTAYRAGEFGLREAVRQQRQVPSGTRLGRFLENPSRHRAESPHIQTIGRYSDEATPLEQAAVAEANFNEFQVGLARERWRQEELTKAADRAGLLGGTETGRRFARFLEHPAAGRTALGGAAAGRRIATGATRRVEGQAFQPGQTEAGEAIIRGALGDETYEVYRRTRDYRNETHEMGFDLAMFGEETYLREGDRWSPRIIEQYRNQQGELAATLGQKPMSVGAANAARDSASTTFKQGRDRYRQRVKTNEQAVEMARNGERALDPGLAIQGIADARVYMEGLRYMQRVAESPVSRGWSEVAQAALRWADLPADQRAAIGLSDETVEAIRGLEAAGQLDVEEAVVGALRGTGWRTWDEVMTVAPSGFMKESERFFDGKLIAPEAVPGMREIGRVYTTPGSAWEKLGNAYQIGMSGFRFGKTALNPATQMRNYYGNIFFNFLATGKFSIAPTRGVRALVTDVRKGNTGELEELIDAGIVGNTFLDKEVQDMVEGIAGLTGGTADEQAGGWRALMERFWQSPVGRAASAAGGTGQAALNAAGKMYRLTDELWKGHIYFTNKENHLQALRKMGVPVEEAERQARARAVLDTTKYTPTFLRNSPLTEVSRQLIPFSSFTAEATRIWKNAMIEKPHMAFALVNLFPVLSQASAAVHGMSPDQLDALREQLPNYTHDKLMMMLPPTPATDVPQFLDLSYILPMGSLGQDLGEAENLFFGAVANPGSNPVFNIAAAAATGVDPFTKRELAPKLTEALTGEPVQGEFARRAVGLAEHTLQTMAPPLVPPGFAAWNLIELVRDERDGFTGQPKEPDVARTVLANLFGLRAYEATIPSQLMNVRREQGEVQKKITRWRGMWRRAKAEGDTAAMDTALKNIRALREEMEPGGDTDKYIRDMVKRTEPGKFRTVSTRQLRETVKRGQALGEKLTPEDREMLGELMARLQERTGGRRAPQQGPPTQ